MKTGLELISDIKEKKPDWGSLCFWWLGQQSFIVKTHSTVFYLDPFLSEHAGRNIPPLLKPEEATNADIITGSHNHTDHIDLSALPGMMKASPESFLVAPYAIRETLVKKGLDESRLHFLDDEKCFDDGSIKITAIKAAHEFFDYTPGGGYPHLSYIIETDGVTIFHAGDACIYDGLATRLKKWNMTVAFLPINGRDAKRLKSHCIGNMTYQEAVDLAGTIKPLLTVPAHYEMFSANSENPQLFADYMDVKYPGLKYWIGEHGTATFAANR